jgi:hypothetical protein
MSQKSTADRSVKSGLRCAALVRNKSHKGGPDAGAFGSYFRLSANEYLRETYVVSQSALQNPSAHFIYVVMHMICPGNFALRRGLFNHAIIRRGISAKSTPSRWR